MSELSAHGLREAPPGLGILGIVALLGLATLALIGRAYAVPSVPVGVIVAVRGEVARPGVYRVDPPTVRAALDAAGGPSRGAQEQALVDGDVVIASSSGARRLAGGVADLVLDPIDLNVATGDQLEAVPGIGPALAAAIVTSREANGAFASMAELERVQGVGRGDVAKWSAYLYVVGDPGTTPARVERDVPSAPGHRAAEAHEVRASIAVNTASSAVLQRLPGVGPALASRIIEDRGARGPYRRAEDLLRVRGIGPSTLAKIKPMITLETR